MGTAFAIILGASDPLIYYAFLCRILVLLLPLILYCVHVHFALGKALFLMIDYGILLSCQY